MSYAKTKFSIGSLRQEHRVTLKPNSQLFDRAQTCTRIVADEHGKPRHDPDRPCNCGAEEANGHLDRVEAFLDDLWLRRIPELTADVHRLSRELEAVDAEKEKKAPAKKKAVPA